MRGGISIMIRLLIVLLWLPAAAEAADRNVLLLLADDIGVTDSAIYGSPGAPPTPNLQALANRGLLYTNVWANPVCVPTRGTIYTGRYGFRTGLLHNPAYDATEPAMRLSEITLSEALGDGWARSHIGKWHVSPGNNDPGLQGWPYYAGPPPHSSATGGGYYRWPKWTNGTSQSSTIYATTDQVNEAIAAIERAAERGQTILRGGRVQCPTWPVPSPTAGVAAAAVPEAAEHGRHHRQYFEAMMAALDKEIGRLLAHVDLTTTTVIYLADNGTQGRNLLPPHPANRGKTSCLSAGRAGAHDRRRCGGRRTWPPGLEHDQHRGYLSDRARPRWRATCQSPDRRDQFPSDDRRQRTDARVTLYMPKSGRSVPFPMAATN